MNNDKQYFVYIATNKNRTVLYIGVTNNLVRRMYEHKNAVVPGFTQRYNVHLLIYFEIFNDINEALLREKQLKASSRKKKIECIEKSNPEWNDLYESIIT